MNDADQLAGVYAVRIREIVVLKGSVSSEEALRAVLPWPWTIVYVQDLLGAAVCEANAPRNISAEALRETLISALSKASSLAFAA